MNTKNLRTLIWNNKYENIKEYLNTNGKPDDWRTCRSMANLAVKRVRAGQEPHAIRALMDSNFSFLAIENWQENGLPSCALTKLCSFAWNAQSRKQEALILMREVFEYELQRTEHLPDWIIPINHPEMRELKSWIETQLNIYKHLLPAQQKKPTLVPN